jgi:Cu-Zn family superoxide dismutase
MPRHRFVPVLASAALLVGFAALVSRAQAPPGFAPAGGGGMMGPSPVTKAIAVLHATKKDAGEDARGDVTFTMTPQGVRVVAEIRGLEPGPHGFHIHEFGDIHSDDGMSTGGHFNPTGMQHGSAASPKSHIGDLGNIEANSKGVAKIDLVDPELRFIGPTSIIGRGLVVHAKPDDLKTQPTGNAGDRVAVAVIGIAKAAAPAMPK